MANRITPKVKSYSSNSLIGMASAHMKDYRLSSEQVDIQPEDVGVIILIALYFIENDNAVSRIKLEAYILMLDRLCFEERGVILFGWKLKGGRIRNFKAITDYMLKRGLIRLKGRSYKELAMSGTYKGTGMKKPEKYMTAKEVAELVCITPEKVSRICAEGKVAGAFKKGHT